MNYLFVGFGQETQQFKERAIRKALSCSQPAAALKLIKRVGVDLNKESAKLKGMKGEIDAVLKGIKEEIEEEE